MNVKWKQGYARMSTMVIGFAIFILAAICILIFWGYTDASYQIKANNMAEKIFYAAQDYLEEVASAGGMDEFNETAKKYGKALSISLQERILRENYTQSNVQNKVTDYFRKYKEGDIRYLVLENNETAGEIRDANPILAIYENQITDDNVWNDTCLIEYNAVTGEVLAVFYSKKTERLKYEGSLDDKANVIARDNKSLKQKKQGYFGEGLDEILD